MTPNQEKTSGRMNSRLAEQSPLLDLFDILVEENEQLRATIAQQKMEFDKKSFYLEDELFKKMQKIKYHLDKTAVLKAELADKTRKIEELMGKLEVKVRDEKLKEKKIDSTMDAVTKRIVNDVEKYCKKEISLEEVGVEIFNIVGAENYSKPSLATVFQCFMAATLRTERWIKFGHVLAYCLLTAGKGREEILEGIAGFCREVVAQEEWKMTPDIWNVVAEVLVNAHLPAEDLKGAPPTLYDFKDAFLSADTTLFVRVLKRVTEIQYKRGKDASSWVVVEECKSIIAHLDSTKLNEELMNTTTRFKGNLRAILKQAGCL